MLPMSRLKVLFIPHPMPSHLIPLMALAQQLPREQFNVAFLVPRELHGYLRHNQLPIINLDHHLQDKLTPELTAIGQFDPDVLIDDHNYYTAFSSRIMNKPRISIVRKGSIPFEEVTAHYRHSSGVAEYFESLQKMNLAAMGLWEPATISDLFKGDANIIPSIPSLDALPGALQGNGDYIYSGPLLLGDEEMSGALTYSKETVSVIRNFFDQNSNRQLIYFTKGIADPPEILSKAESCLNALLEMEGVAVITNIRTGLPVDERRYFFNRFLPMNLVCCRVQLMIHQCGSGAYNYQLLNEVPGIALGSKCYDRDDIAMQLERQGTTAFITADQDEASYLAQFKTAVASLLDNTSVLYVQQKTALAQAKQEIAAVRQQFDLSRIIRKVVGAVPV